MKSPLVFLLAGSFLLQMVQLGVFPIFVAQILAAKNTGVSTIGLYLAIPWIALLILGPLVPRLFNRFGFVKMNAIGLALSFLSLLILTKSESNISIVISSIMMGMGLIIRWILSDTLVIQFSSENKKGSMIGIHEALMGLGIGCGPLVFTIMDLEHVALASLALCSLGILCFLKMHLLEAQDIDQHASIIAPEQSIIDLRTLLRTNPFWVFTLAAAFVAGFIESASVGLFPLSFDDAGFSLSTAALLVSSFGFGGTILQPPLGWGADRYGYRKMQMLCISTIIFTSVIVLANMNSLPLLYVAIFLMGAAAGGLNTLAVIQAGKLLHAKTVPMVMTIIAMLYTVGSIAGHILSGLSLQAVPVFGIFWGFIFICILLGGLNYLMRMRSSSEVQ